MFLQLEQTKPHRDASGSTKPPWWQDWRGQACAIIASGPSTKSANVSLLQNRIKVIAIKENIDLCPWADVVYGCDLHWWVHRRGLPTFKGLKIAYDCGAWTRFPDLKKIEIKNKASDQILTETAGHIGSGGNSGFQALNIAVQFGACRILLIGFDMQDRSGAHWYGRNAWTGANNPSESNFRRWRATFDNNADRLRSLGIDVINASPISHLKAFKKMSVEDALAAWGL